MSFQKTLPEIATPIAAVDVPVDLSGAERIQGLGKLAGQTVKDIQKGRLQSDLQQSADVVSAVKGAMAEKGRSVFDAEGEISTEGLSPDLQQQINRVKANAGVKFKRISNALRQGATSEAAAALETEATVRELMNQTPGFSQEIRQLAREQLGFDPTGFALRQVLSADQAKPTKLTATQRLEAEADSIVSAYAKVGKHLNRNTVIGNLGQRNMLKVEREIIDAELEIGTVNMRQWAQKSYVEKGADLSLALDGITRMSVEGGVTDPRQYANAVISAQEAHKAAFKQQVALKGSGMSTAEMAAIESQIDRLYKPLIDGINQNKFGDILTDKLETITKVNQLWGKQALPKLTRIIDAVGDRVGGQLLEMMSNIADPNQFELIYQFDPALKAVIEGAGLTQKGAADGVERLVSKVIKGQAITEDDLQFRKITEVMVTQPGATDLREAYVKGLGESGSPVRAVSILSTKVPRAQATPDEIKFMKDQYNIHVGTPATENVPGNLIDGMAKEIFELDVQGLAESIQTQPVIGRTQTQEFMGIPVAPTGQTKITIPFDPTGQGKALNFQTDSMKRMQPFMDAILLKGYAPDMGVSKEAFAESVMNRVNDRLTQMRTKRDEDIALAKEKAKSAAEDEIEHEGLIE